MRQRVIEGKIVIFELLDILTFIHLAFIKTASIFAKKLLNIIIKNFTWHGKNKVSALQDSCKDGWS